MAKTLFNVTLPATGNRYDLWVPNELSMQEATALIAEAMQVAEPGFYRWTPDAALMFRDTGEIQQPTATVADLGFTDGDRFVLI